MAQNTDIAQAAIRYTRADFTALRAWLNRLPVERIASLYYTDDDLELLDCASSVRLAARLDGLRDRLIQQVVDANPHLAEMLRNARRTSLWSAKLVDFLVRAADTDMTTPRRQDAVSAWFKPRVAEVLRADGVRRLGDLMSLIEVRGSGWWRPIRRIGAGKAARIERWLGEHAGSLGVLHPAETPPLAGELVSLSPEQPRLVPIERAALPAGLDGREGKNRNSRFCQISAGNDREAIDAYLYRFRGQEKTRRAYQKEIERFLLWCVLVRRIPMSSALHEDCEAYKDFLADIPADWIGPKRQRGETQWRPFAGPLSPASQRYAVQAIRFFFAWLVDVRYLGGNPWATIGNPPVAKALLPLQIDKALPENLWQRLTESGGILDRMCCVPDDELRRRYRLRGAGAALSMAAQFRLARAALLLIGDTGIRREEAAYATRDRLRPIPEQPELWELDVLGKRNKWRTVFPSRRAIDALAAHWNDRGLDFSFGLGETPLLSPLVAPGTRTARSKHLDDEGSLRDSGFSPDGLYRLIKTTLQRIADDLTLELDAGEREHLRRSATHAFRHTFGTQAVAGDVPLDVVQKVLGHASLQTTTLYVQAEKKRSIDELGRFFGKR